VFTRPVSLLAVLAVSGFSSLAPGRDAPRDRRIVDVVAVGNAASEAAHGYAASDATVGVAAGAPCRQTRGWMHFALKTFEDTDVTVALTVAGTDSVSRQYDVVVEDSLIATRTYSARGTAPTVVEIAVPFSVTKGRANIAVVIRARGGSTPALLAVRTIQDHNEFAVRDFAYRELAFVPNPLGVTR
jgi:hypothetical protein